MPLTNVQIAVNRLSALAKKVKPYVETAASAVDVVSSWPISELIPDRHEKTIRGLAKLIKTVSAELAAVCKILNSR